MFFICVSIRTLSGTSKRVIKPWYARTVIGDKSLSDIFNDFAIGEFDGTGISIEESYQSAQVSNRTNPFHRFLCPLK